MNAMTFLGYEEFRAQRDNFGLFFCTENAFGEVARETEVYRRSLDCPGFAELAERLMQIPNMDLYSGAYDELLYEAYEIMHPFAASRADLLLAPGD